MITGIRNNSKKLAVMAFMIAFISFGCRFYFDTTKDNFTAHTSNTSLQNGENLTYNVCGGCHYDAATKRFTGKYLNDLPKIAGKLYAANITHSLSDGMTAKYSDAELFYLLKTGIARNGKFMPYMMRPMMADEDVNDIISFLRSDNEALTAADTTVGLTHINFLGKFGLRLAASPQPYNKGIPRPDENDPKVYGRYIADVTGCYHCHSKKQLKLDYLDPEASKFYMQGGMKFKDPSGKRLYSPNLTPDKETGIGNYTLADFNEAVTKGVSPGGRKLSPPMPMYKHLTDKQVNALYVYLNSLKPVHHEVRKP